MHNARFSSVCLIASHADDLRACFVSPSCPTNSFWNKRLNSFSIFFANISWRSAANYPRINQFVGKERVRKRQVRLCERIYAAIDKWLHLNPLVPRAIKVHFLLMIPTHNPDKMLWELIKWSAFGRCFDLQTGSLNLFCKGMYGDQFGEFVSGYWGLKG